MVVRRVGWTVVVGLLLGAMIWKAQAVCAQDFVIRSFHADITIAEDSSFAVEETIEVEFLRPRHGIYREVPIRYVNELGKSHVTPTRVLSVRDHSGKEWKYRVSRSGNLLNIRIGDPKRYVSGRQTYILTYGVENAILFLEGKDELYWNVTGNYWKASMDRASAKVLLNVGGKSSEHGHACYTGPPGSTESECSARSSATVGEFHTTRKLEVGEGLTVAYSWDKGLVRPPSDWQLFLWRVNLAENWVFGMPALVLVVMLRLWRNLGRDPKVREVVTVMYGPPQHGGKPLAPAEVGTLIDEKLDSRDITAAVVGLAVDGYLKIEEADEEGLLFKTRDYRLIRSSSSVEGLTGFQRTLLAGLFPGNSNEIEVTDLKNRFYTHLDALRGAAYEELVHKGYFKKRPDAVRHSYTAFAIGGAVLGTVGSAFLLTGAPAKGMLASLLSGVVVLLFGRAMPARTSTGALARLEVLGFEEFLDRAERDRLERMADPHLFSRFLPYAIALDVSDNWAKAFEGIYQEPPDWYTSRTPLTYFHPHGFSRSMGTMTSSLAGAMFAAPRSSGSGGGGGGGSSGGGFGGGGGGSW